MLFLLLTVCLVPTLANRLHNGPTSEKETEAIPLMQLSVMPMAINSTVNAICPDPTYTCPGTETCCPSSTDTGWGCCPSADAVCCIDRLHCCPNGFVCSGIECVSATVKEVPKKEIMSLSKPLVHPKKSISTFNPICPDPTYSCSGTETCCPSSTATGWGCCPSPDAVCCPDLATCCPNGLRCVTGGCA